MITAVVLSANDYRRKWEGLDVLVVRSTIRTAADLQAARFGAVNRVRAPHFFFLDDDDDLPEDYLDVLDECVRTEAALTYTDEMVNEKPRCSAPYSQRAHFDDALLVHHLALYRTADAQDAVRRLPRGHYCPEFMLSWEVAKRGAAYIPRIGYRWNRRATGMHTWPCTSLSQTRALLWAKENP